MDRKLTIVTVIMWAPELGCGQWDPDNTTVCL